MRKTFVFALLLCSLPCFQAPGATPQTTRKMLHQPIEIQGYPCANDFAWFYADGHLQRCFVSRETTIGEINIPKGSIVNLLPDGRPEYAMLAQDTLLLGMDCSGGGPLGPGEGAMTDLYPSGKFQLCFLAEDQVVQGVPCGGGGFFHAIVGHDVPVELHENGKLKSCRLTADYAGHHRNDFFTPGP
ncbi:MAG: hypothetical protein ABSF28_14135 [Terracidiphilus sp.]|jgi:hypothetical protein